MSTQKNSIFSKKDIYPEYIFMIAIFLSAFLEQEICMYGVLSLGVKVAVARRAPVNAC